MNTERRVLVVDDEPGMFDVIEALLFREGHELIYAASGQEAINALQDLQPDVILMDVMMPDMDGLETCRRIKANETWRNIPVIMVTALSSKEDLARSLDAGADDFLSKPVNGIELRARVRSMLRIKEQYDALQSTLQLREDLSNMVVHDLRNPLTSIILANQMLLLQSNLTDFSLQRLNLIQKAAKDLNSMVDDLLMLAKMDSGKLILNLTEVDLHQLITATLTAAKPIAETRQLYLESRLPPQQRLFPLDASLFQRVLDNLLSNAIKFSPNHSTIIVSLEYLEPSAEFVKAAKLQVIDEGPGVTQEMRDRIFNKYEIGEKVDSAKQIGLGLTFCKMVIDAHGGQISVENNIPQGAIFTIQI